MSGEFDEASGKVKQAASDLTDDHELKHEGDRQEGAGKVKQFGDKVKDKIDDVGNKVKD